MASGFGLNGGKSSYTWQNGRLSRHAANFQLPGPGRCFPFWQEVLACYVVNTDQEDQSGKKKCVPVLEDYYECMHHKKEVGLTTQWAGAECGQA